jgi:hypothetical protein
MLYEYPVEAKVIFGNCWCILEQPVSSNLSTENQSFVTAHKTRVPPAQRPNQSRRLFQIEHV